MGNHYIVYMLTLEDGRVYIGMTGQKLSSRCRSTAYNQCPALGRAIRDYGWNAFRVSVIAEHLTRTEAERIEMESIARYDSTNPLKGFNVALGGNIPGRHSTITRQKMADAQKGRKFSKEHLQKLRKPKLKVTPRSTQPVCRHVLQYDTNGNLIREFESAHIAANNVGCWEESIRRCCNHLQHTCVGYKWEYGRRDDE